MRLVSLDTSTTKSGVALFVDGKLSDYKLLDCSGTKEIEERMDEMGAALLRQLKEFAPNLVYIEMPKGGGGNVEMVRKLSEILGIVRAYCISKGVEHHEIMPSQWRKYCGIEQGKRTRSELKQLSMNYVKEQYGIEVNNDVADAICIGVGVINQYSQED